MTAGAAGGPGGHGPSLRPATAADLDALRALLERLRLPASDLGDPRQWFLVAHDGPELVGCVGLEAYGDAALLRSLAVAPARQGAGVGRALHEAAVGEAARRGTRALYLLTTTAERFFDRAGFARIDRAAVPADVAASAEFQSLCPASAVCMVKRLR